MEQLFIDPDKETVAESLGLSKERSEELSGQQNLVWHELTTPTKEFNENGLDIPAAIAKFDALAQTEGERVLCAYSFGRIFEKYRARHEHPLTRIFSTLKGK